MENTLENKAKFFAQHLFQAIIVSSEYDNNRYKVEPYSLTIIRRGNNSTRLELKSLSSITDEDAIEVAKILVSNTFSKNLDVRVAKKSEVGEKVTSKIVYIGDIIVVIDSLKIIGTYNGFIDIADFNIYLSASDYLRSKSYALPWVGLSVETMVGYGWIKLTETDNG